MANQNKEAAAGTTAFNGEFDLDVIDLDCPAFFQIYYLAALVVVIKEEAAARATASKNYDVYGPTLYRSDN
ncbi:hypothetical protein ACFPYJ_02245 [Paenibacillus solisilvae]|uniref:Uncharacterized protein n=1 Tax=Paenibacillus solisilvae TaxID=2486751 RepID=A0ABW0VPY6_9BACL